MSNFITKIRLRLKMALARNCALLFICVEDFMLYDYAQMNFELRILQIQKLPYPPVRKSAVDSYKAKQGLYKTPTCGAYVVIAIKTCVNCLVKALLALEEQRQ